MPTHVNDDVQTRGEVAAAVREAIRQVPPLNNIRLDVVEEGIHLSSVAEQRWWRVPVTATPASDRLFPVYELMAEVQEYLYSQHWNVILFPEDAMTDSAAA